MLSLPNATSKPVSRDLPTHCNRLPPLTTLPNELHAAIFTHIVTLSASIRTTWIPLPGTAVPCITELVLLRDVLGGWFYLFTCNCKGYWSFFFPLNEVLIIIQTNFCSVLLFRNDMRLSVWATNRGMVAKMMCGSYSLTEWMSVWLDALCLIFVCWLP